MKKLKNDVLLIKKGLKEIRTIRSGFIGLIITKNIFSSISPFINIYMSALIINSLEKKQTFEYLMFLAVITVGANFCVSLISSTLNSAINIRRAEFNVLYSNKKGAKITKMKYCEVENPATHCLYQKINDYENMNNGGIMGLLEAIDGVSRHIFTIVFSISLTVSLFWVPQSFSSPIASIITSPITTIIIIIAVISNVFISMYSNSTMEKNMYLMMNDATQFNRTYEYYLENYIANYQSGKDIRIYKQQDLISDEYNTLLDTVKILLKKLFRNQINHTMLMTISKTLLNCIIYLYVGIKALSGIFGVGSVVQYVGSITQFSAGLTGLITQISLLRVNNEALACYFKFMDIPEDDDQGHLSINLDKSDDFVIEFKNVSFKYPNTQMYALRNINLILDFKKSLAIVGMNGSGKTTLIKLLLRLYNPTEGIITLNGIDINQYRYKDYISVFGVVFQDSRLFSFGLGQNISSSDLYDEAKAISCLNNAGFGQRLETMPKGLETYLYKDFDEEGVEISGGEAQKVALARALYKDAPYIVLDEPTAALDPVAEYEIYSSFNKLMENKNVIFISHRLSSCRFCDNIAVFHMGELVQWCNHDDLLNIKNGKYFELWNAQAQYYNESTENMT